MDSNSRFLETEPMTDLHRLAVVLRHANSDPPFIQPQRESFYALKQAILEAFGTRDGEDVQHIVDKCYRCTDGIYTGRYYDDPDDGVTCWKCGGTGKFREYCVVLDRWILAKHVFHRPARRVVGSLVPCTIEGRIRHRRSKMAKAAQLVLALIFRPQYYLYLEQWKLGTQELSRFKVCLAYLLGFPRDKWHVKSVRFGEISANAFAARMHDVPMPSMVPF